MVKLSSPALWLGALSLGVLALVIYWEDSRTHTSPISRVHAQVAGIGGPQDCQQCHGEDSKTPAEACLECHEPIQFDLRAKRGLHGRTIVNAEDRCGECHLEHAGREFNLVGPHSFGLAGYGDRQDFDHPWPDYGLDGAHEDLECVACHKLADNRLLLAGQQRFRGLSQDCLPCHDDSPHEGQMQRECTQCHGQALPFKDLSQFEHDKRFPLEGVHALDQCADCHERHSEHGFERLASLNEQPPVRDCDACHEPPHATSFLGNLAAARIPEDAPLCQTCHALEDPTWETAESTFQAVRHGASGFHLEAPHDTQACADCHGRELDWEARYPGRTRQECENCHEDAHQGQFEKSFFEACADCHATKRFVPAAFDLEEHALSAFPLEGAHRSVGCNACHEEVLEWAPDRQWTGLKQRCDACHEDSHDGTFEAHALAIGAAPPEDCDACHDQESFASQGTEDQFEHGDWTAFALNGEHAQIDCRSCHENSPRDELGRCFGRIEQAYGAAPTSSTPCLSCHVDPHDGTFDGPNQPTTWEGQAGCARCHDETNFRNASLSGFDHDQWTKRKLTGAHLSAQCDGCHQRTPLPDKYGRTFGRPAAVFSGDIGRCVTCHADVHLGLFDKDPANEVFEGRRDCARCHGEQYFRSPLRTEFDHDLWAQTDLASGHQNQSCESCHPSLGFIGMGGRTREAARGRECLDCHADPHVAQFHESERNACDDCHGDQEDWSVLTFDHDIDSRYALDSNHKDVACADCHPTLRQVNGTDVVLYRPVGMECADCHTAPKGPLR